MRPLSSPSPFPKLRRAPTPKPRNPSPTAALTPCKHSATATVDVVLLLLVFLSLAFLIASSLSPLISAVARSLPLLIASLPPLDSPYPFLAGLLILLVLTIAAVEFSRQMSHSSRCCQNPRCRGLTKAREFDVQLQTEERVKLGSSDPVWVEIEGLPWKGGQEGNNPDYECLRAELRRLAPTNGRAVLLFRSRCGCAVAKLEAWAPKRSRRHKKNDAEASTYGGRREKQGMKNHART